MPYNVSFALKLPSGDRCGPTDHDGAASAQDDLRIIYVLAGNSARKFVSITWGVCEKALDLASPCGSTRSVRPESRDEPGTPATAGDFGPST